MLRIISFKNFIKEEKDEEDSELEKQKKILAGRWSNMEQRLKAARYILNHKKK